MRPPQTGGRNKRKRKVRTDTTSAVINSALCVVLCGLFSHVRREFFTLREIYIQRVKTSLHPLSEADQVVRGVNTLKTGRLLCSCLVATDL